MHLANYAAAECLRAGAGDDESGCSIHAINTLVYADDLGLPCHAADEPSVMLKLLLDGKCVAELSGHEHW